MKGRKISTYEFSLQNLSENLLKYMFDENPHREDAITTETEEYKVDTCYGFDTGCWETGISANGFNDRKWIIVDEYKDRKCAEKGHQKWVDFMGKKPKKLTDVHIDKTYLFSERKL